MSDLVNRVRAALDGKAQALPFASYADRPVDFAVEVLGLTLWSHQKRALDAMAKSRRVAWRSAHGVGKTITVSAAIAWFVSCFADAVVIITAPSYRQVRSVDWRTLSQVRRRAKQPLGGEFMDSPEHGWRFDDGRIVIGYSAGDGERFAGFHSPNLMVIVDEAAGVEAPIFEALKGALTASSRLMLVGNPTRTSGEFFDAFNRKSKLWHVLHTSALDVPNVSGGEPAIEGLIDRTWVDEMAEDYGEDSPVYAVRCLGEFPSQSANAVISLQLVEDARRRYDEMKASPSTTPAFHSAGRLVIGCDPARYGDDESAIVVRRGNQILPPITFRNQDGPSLARHVLEIALAHCNRDERPIVRVDSIGIGASVYDSLRQHSNISVEGINAGETAASSELYERKRDELWFLMREYLKGGGMLPPDARLEAELIAPTYEFSPRQKIKVESKDSIKARLKRSPDRADAFALAVYDAGVKPATFGDLPFKPQPLTFGEHVTGRFNGGIDDPDDELPPGWQTFN